MRIQVILNDDLVKHIDEYAKSIGMSRSSICAYFIGQGMYGLNKGLEMASGYLNAMAAESVRDLQGSSDTKVK